MSTEILQQISNQIEDILDRNNKNVSYFQSTEHNFDTKQNLNMNESKKELERAVEKNKINVNDFSITDAKDYLGCIGNQCQNLDQDLGEHHLLDTNISNNGENKEDSSKKSNNFITNLDYIISFIYIFLVSVLLIASILNRKNNNLIYIILLTLVFIFYKIYFVK